MKQAMNAKDKKTKDNIKFLTQITDTLKKGLLQAYFKRCENKHAMAFFQWRAMLMEKRQGKQEQKIVEPDSDSNRSKDDEEEVNTFSNNSDLERNFPGLL